MGGGRTPGPVGGSAEPGRIDDGTSARTRSPAPGSIGLGAKGGAKEAGHSPAPAAPADSAAPASTAVQAVDYAAIVAYAEGLLGQVDGDGECFTLVNNGLAAGHAAGAAAYGRVRATAEYEWGTRLELSQIQPGDVVQFSNYSYEWRTVVRRQDGTTASDDSQTQERLHHSAIVQSVEEDGSVWVLEQNSPPGTPVTSTQLHFTNQRFVNGRTTVTITVQGRFEFYHPQPPRPAD